MILYHVSTMKIHEGFVPRIPYNRMEGEDETFTRICVSDTLEGCFSAMPNGGASLEILQEETKGFYYVYMFNSDEISEGKLMTPDELYENGLVEDATHTGEYWILEQATPFKSSVIYLEECDEKSVDIYPYEVSRLIEEHDMDIYEAMEIVCPERMDIYSITLIQDIVYYEGTLEVGERLEFYHCDEWDQFKDDIPYYSEDNLDLTKEYMIKANDNISLEELRTWVLECTY